MKTFKTPKGTDLPITNIKGKDYLEAKYRVVWFREEHPDWGIETDIISHDAEASLCRATIRNEMGRIMAQASKEETRQGFPDHLEKAETSAIARALALIGFGTQFANEFEEGNRLADSPVNSSFVLDSKELGAYIIKIGKKLKGLRLDKCDVYELADFSKWLTVQPNLEGVGLETRDCIEAYLKTVEQRKVTK